MRKIMLSLLSLILLIVIVLLTMPLIMGFWIQAAYPRIVNQLISSPNFSVQVVEYHRGWFSSDAKLQIGIKTPLLSINNLILRTHIQHGPFIVVNTDDMTRVVFARALFTSQTQIPGLSAQAATLWTWSNEFQSTFQAPELSLGNADTLIHLKGLQFQANFAQVSKSLDTQINIASGKISAAAKDNTANADSVEFNSLRIAANWIKQQNRWNSKREVAVNSVLLTQNNKITQVSDLLARLNQLQEGDSSQLRLNLLTKNVLSDNINLSHLQMLLTLQHLKTQAFYDFLQKIVILEDTEQADSQFSVISQLVKPFMQIVGNGVNIYLKQLSFDTPDGAVSGQAQILVPEQTSTLSYPYFIKNTQVQAQLELPRNWLNQQLINFYSSKKSTDATSTADDLAKNDLDQWVQARWLVPFKDSLLMQAHYSNGEWVVNDTRLR